VSLARPAFQRFVAALLVFATPATAAHAQSLKSLRLQVDNDWFLFWRPSTNRPDDNYTHGNFARAVFNTAPRWARFGRSDCSAARHISPAPTACVQSFFNLTQQIFTPTIDAPMPIPGQRPYAGLLTGEYGAQLVSPRHLLSLGIGLGTTGRNSGAEASQKAFHRWANIRRVVGWDYQIAAQPVVGITYGQQYLLTPPRVGQRSAVTAAAQGSAIATTIQSGADAGLEIHAGYNAPHPWMTPSSSERHRFRAYAILGAKESWVARNLLLEGNSAETRGLVAKKPFVFETVWGLAAGVGGYFVEYRAVSMTRDYETAPSWHRWGTIAAIIGIP
jgi:lipid A 3-O-deacylase